MYEIARKLLKTNCQFGAGCIKVRDRHGRSWLLTEVTLPAIKSMKPRVGRPLLFSTEGPNMITVYPTPDDYYEYQSRTAVAG